MIEVHLLRYVLAAADTGSFSRAADQFGIKQSTLSKRVQYFERRLGLSLFTRSTRGVVPTDPGERFLSKARRILQDVDALARESRSLAKGESGTLRLGFHGSLAAGDLSAAFQAFREACPAIDIRASERDRAQLLAALKRDNLDLAVCAGECGHPGTETLSFWREPVMLFLPAGHPLTAQDRIFWTDLRHLEFVVTGADPGPDIADMIVSRLAGPGHRPTIIPQDVSRENLMQFVAGNRIAVSSGIQPLPLPAGGLVPREVHDAFGPTTLDQSIYWRRDNGNPVLRRFLELVAARHRRTLPPW